MIVEGEKNGLTFEEFVDLTLALRFPSEEWIQPLTHFSFLCSDFTHTPHSTH
jgi:hypothetical protein